MKRQKGLRCPKCNSLMEMDATAPYLDPFEVKYHCVKCDSFFVWHSWSEYFESCTCEKLERLKKVRELNPSFRRETHARKIKM